MANIPVLAISINAMTIATNARILAQMRNRQQISDSSVQNEYVPSIDDMPLPKKKAELAEIPEIMQQKFKISWKAQQEQLSMLETELADSYEYNTIREFGWTVGEKKYRYSNGIIAKVEKWDGPDREITLYDEVGNCIEDDFGKYTYYPKTKQLEFAWTTLGIEHYNKNGKEDTKRYLAKLQMASKRIEEEKKTGITFEKMSKVEKAVAKVFKNKPQMTTIEKMLARKAQSSRKNR